MTVPRSPLATEAVRAPRVQRHDRASAARLPWVAAAVGLLAALVGYVGAGVPAYWGDEAASLMSAERDWPSLWGMLGRVDAVHGLYYAVLHVWIDLFGTSEWATRALSCLALGALAAGTVILGARWFDLRVGVVAGVLCAVLPRATYFATETRSYALAAAAAVWLTIAFTALVRGRRTELWRWMLYGFGLVASVVLFLHLALLVFVHAVALAALRPRPSRRLVGRWAVAVAVGVVISAPFVAVALSQRDQLAYLALRAWASPEHVLVTQWFVIWPVAAVAWALAAFGVVAALFPRGGRAAYPVPPGLWPTLAWVVLPTALLLLVDAVVTKAYSPRYTFICAPAIAMLIAFGIERLARTLGELGSRADASSSAAGSAHPHRRAWVTNAVAVLLVAALAAAALPAYLEQRTERAKDGGTDYRAVAEYVREHARPGDAVVFGLADRRSREPRLALRLYPDAFTGLVDAQLVTAYTELPELWDIVAPLERIAPDLTSPTVWAIDATGSPRGGDEQRVTPTDPRVMEAAGYRLVEVERFPRTVISRFDRAD